MKTLLNTDKYTNKVYNTYNGKTERQWIMYGDKTYEPVRRDQSVRNKWTSPHRPVDWFVVQEDEDFDPAKAGHKVSLNHDYGQEDKPGGPHRARPVTPEKKNARLEGNGPDKTQFKPLPIQPGLSERVKTRQTTLGQGPEAYHEYEKRRQAAKMSVGTAEGTGDAGKGDAGNADAGKGRGADKAPEPRNSAKDARDLSKWEREQGIDPNQGSGHENRPPSSLKDAAEMDKKRCDGETLDYPRWINRMKNDPPWKDKQTPTQKVQDVTHPIGEEVAMVAFEELLKNSGSQWSKVLGKVLSRAGIASDILGNADDVW